MSPNISPPSGSAFVTAGLPPDVFYDEGSGLSPSLGIEAVYEYNGLTINDREGALDYYHLSSIDGLNSVELRDSRDNKPDEDGEDEWDDQTLRTGRTIVMTGQIRCGRVHKLRDMWRALEAAFVPRTQPLTIYGVAGAPDVQINCRRTLRIEGADSQADYKAPWPFRRDFQITLKAARPDYLGLTQRSVTFTPTNVAQLARFYPRIYTSGGFELYDKYMDAQGHVTVGATAFNANNQGTAQADLVVEMGGQLAGLQIINQTNGQKLTFKREIPAGQIYTYDPVEGNLTDTTDVNRFGVLDTRNTTAKFSLDPGVNQFTVSVTAYSGTPYVKLYWHDTY